MNSLNIISSRVSPGSSPAPSRTNSLGSLGLAVQPEDTSVDDHTSAESGYRDSGVKYENPETLIGPIDDQDGPSVDEDTMLLHESKESSTRSTIWHLIPRRIATSFINSIRWVLSTLAAPGVYLFACLYDEHGIFAPFSQLGRIFGRTDSASAADASLLKQDRLGDEKIGRDALGRLRGDSSALSRPTFPSGSSSSGLSSDSESEPPKTDRRGTNSTAQRHNRSRSSQSSVEGSQTRRSIKINLNNDDALRQRKHRKTQSSGRNQKSGETPASDISVQLKSPTSPAGALTKYPRTPAPPRPLIPRRQPSYINLEPTSPKHQKTLILDLDETLIHSISKGGRMGTGHMVEVRLNTTYVGHGGQTSIGPQHPILYYVHKRPHCDDFLRRVCKWYNLVIFTASVQEYADPVIDWLESERKLFSGRLYRQHCTFRQGAFIKDLSSVEPDLSKVMILDNSPLSYMFHQDNAIPIQGWINDPTDNDLLHLVPLLEGLQYVSDVRALLALRGGEDGHHMA